MVLAQPPVPLRPLAVLIVAVLAAHLLLLQATPGAISLEEPPASRKFITRTININRPEAASSTVRATAAPAPEPRPAAPAPSSRHTATLRQPADTDTTLPAPRVAESPASAPAPVPAQQASAEPPALPTPPAPPAPTAPPASGSDAPRATAFSIPGSIKLNYAVVAEVKKLPYNANGTLLWRHDGVAYEARMDVSAVLYPTRTQTSAGRITSEGLAPTRFADKSRSEVAAHFDRERGRIVFSANTPEAALLPGAQDRLSVFLQLASMLAGEPSKYPQGTSITIQTVGPREAENWVFTVDGEEKLNLVNGETPSVKLTRNPRRDYDIKAEVWLAPALGYLPARLRLTQQNGDFVDQQLRSTDRP